VGGLLAGALSGDLWAMPVFCRFFLLAPWGEGLLVAGLFFVARGVLFSNSRCVIASGGLFFYCLSWFVGLSLYSYWFVCLLFWPFLVLLLVY
jgi:hypothetical protein